MNFRTDFYELRALVECCHTKVQDIDNNPFVMLDCSYSRTVAVATNRKVLGLLTLRRMEYEHPNPICLFLPLREAVKALKAVGIEDSCQISMEIEYDSATQQYRKAQIIPMYGDKLVELSLDIPVAEPINWKEIMPQRSDYTTEKIAAPITSLSADNLKFLQKISQIIGDNKYILYTYSGQQEEGPSMLRFSRRSHLEIIFMAPRLEDEEQNLFQNFPYFKENKL